MSDTHALFVSAISVVLERHDISALDYASINLVCKEMPGLVRTKALSLDGFPAVRNDLLPCLYRWIGRMQSPTSLTMSYTSQLVDLPVTLTRLVLDGVKAGALVFLRLSSDIYPTQVANAAALSHLVRLRTLILHSVAVYVIEPLTVLTALTCMKLTLARADRNVEIDFTPLAAFAALRCLHLQTHTMPETLNTGIFAEMDSLRELSVKGVSVKELEPLVALEQISIDRFVACDISVLSEMRALTRVDFSFEDTEVFLVERDFTPLSHLLSLQWLNLSHTNISALWMLSGLRRIEYLELYHTAITDINPLAELVELTHLDLCTTRVSEVTPLSRLIALNWLDMSTTCVSDIRLLDDLTRLQHLNLSNTTISEAAALSRMTLLTRLNLSNTHVHEIISLASITALASLNLTHTRVINFSPLTRLTCLQTLGLSRTAFMDASLLTGLVGLESLSISKTNICDFSPLSSLKGLKSMDMSDTLIRCLEPLSGLTNLSHLCIAGAMFITTIKPLTGLVRLNRLFLCRASVTDLTPLTVLTSLNIMW